MRWWVTLSSLGHFCLYLSFQLTYCKINYFQQFSTKSTKVLYIYRVSGRNRIGRVTIIQQFILLSKKKRFGSAAKFRFSLVTRLRNGQYFLNIAIYGNICILQSVEVFLVCFIIWIIFNAHTTIQTSKCLVYFFFVYTFFPIHSDVQCYTTNTKTPQMSP